MVSNFKTFRDFIVPDDMYRPDGRKFDGGWKQGKQHGEGLYTTRAQDLKRGTWNDGERFGKWEMVRAAAK